MKLLFSIFFLALVVFARADGRPDDDDDDGTKPDDFSVLEQEKDDDLEVKFRSRTRNSKVRYEFFFRIKIDDELKLEVRYMERGAVNRTENRFRASIKDIVFYTPDGTPGFSGSEDFDRLLIKDLSWKAIDCMQTTTGFTCTANTTNDLFTVRVYLTTSTVDLGTIVLTPTGLKFDVIIQKPSGTELASAALNITFATTRSISSKVEDDDDDDEKKIFLDGSEGFFKFVPTYTIESLPFGGVVISEGDVIYSAPTPLINVDDDDDDQDDDDQDDDDFRGARSMSFAFESNSSAGYYVWDPQIAVTTLASAGSLVAVSMGLVLLSASFLLF